MLYEYKYVAQTGEAAACIDRNVTKDALHICKMYVIEDGLLYLQVFISLLHVVFQYNMR